MKEIGGYLELERFSGREYHTQALRVNCARNAIVLAARRRQVKRVFLPYYLCGSVADALERNGIERVFYRVDPQFQPVIPEDCGKEDMLLAVDLFGQLDTDRLMGAYGDRTNVLLDTTQAFFKKPPKNADMVCSCRKYFGVPDGAYLYTDLTDGSWDLEPEKVAGRCGHLIGRMEGIAGAHLEAHRRNDRIFAERPIAGMSLFSQNILRAIDYEAVKILREVNFRKLHDALQTRNTLELIVPEAPFAYPFYIENGIQLRKMLAEQKIYVPTLWPDVLKLPESWTERNYAENILPLPCDQRYSPEDMDRILEVLYTCIT